MTKFDPKINTLETVSPVIEERFRAKQLFKVPQPAITAADNTVFISGMDGDVTDAAIPTLNNMRTRIGEIETALRNIGLLS